MRQPVSILRLVPPLSRCLRRLFRCDFSLAACAAHPARIESLLRRSMLAALEKAVRVFVAAGAVEVASLHTGLPSHIVAPELNGRAAPGENTPLDEWLVTMRSRGLLPNGVGIFSAHQMGSCRMGSDPALSVVDPNGESAVGTWMGLPFLSPRDGEREGIGWVSPSYHPVMASATELDGTPLPITR